MSDTLHDAAERLIASMPDGVSAGGIRQRVRQRRRRRNITWIAAAVMVTTGGLATVRLVQQSPQEIVPADTAPAASVSIAPTTTAAPEPTTVPETTSPPSTTTTSTTFPNRPPIAVDDLIAIVQDSSVSVPVLANDTDPDGDRLHVVAVIGGTDGTAALDGDSVVYTPAAGMTGAATFTYVVEDEVGAVGSATVTIVIGG